MENSCISKILIEKLNNVKYFNSMCYNSLY